MPPQQPRANTRFTGHRGPVYALAKAHATGGFLSAASDGTVVRWNLHEPATGSMLAKAERAIFALHHPGPQVLYLGDVDGGLHVIDLERRTETQMERAHGKGIYRITTLPGRQVAVAGGDGAISLWVPESRNGPHLKHLRSIPLTDDKVRDLAPSPDGTLLAVACGDGRIHILDTRDLNERYTLPGHVNGANCLAWHPGKPVLVSGGKDGHLRLWHARDGFRPMMDLPAHKDTIYRMAFSHYGNLCATAGRDKCAKLWDAGSFAPVRRLDRLSGGHNRSVNDLLWSDNGLITCSDDNQILAWPMP